MPGVTTASGSSSPTSTTSRTCAIGERRRGRHHRAEVAGGLAVHQIAHPVAAVRPDQRHVAADRVLQHVVAAVDRRGSPCPRRAACRRRSGSRTRRCPRRPRASARRDCPAAPPRARSCPPGTARRTPRSRSAAGTSRSPCAPARRPAARPARVAVAGVVVDDRQVAGALLDAARRSASTGCPAMPNPPISTVTPSAIAGHRFAAGARVDHGSLTPGPRRRPAPAGRSGTRCWRPARRSRSPVCSSTSLISSSVSPLRRAARTCMASSS